MDAVHKQGKEEYRGHHDPWLDHEKTILRSEIAWTKELRPIRTFNDSDPLSFTQTKEQFGITQIPDVLRIQCNFDGLPILDPQTTTEESLTHVYPLKLHRAALSGKQSNIYEYLASAQRTKYAVTPVHKEAEFLLFNSAFALGGEWFTAHGDPPFSKIAAWWSGKSNGKTIFYKLPEHLSTHYTKWMDQKLRKENLVQSQAQRQSHQKRIQSSTHIAQVMEASVVFDTRAANKQHTRAIEGLLPDFVPTNASTLVADQSDIIVQSHASAVDQSLSLVDNVDIGWQPYQSLNCYEDTSVQSMLPYDHLLNAETHKQVLAMSVPSTVPSGSGATFRSWTPKVPEDKAKGPRIRRCMICFEAGRTLQMNSCPGRNNRKHCTYLMREFSLGS